MTRILIAAGLLVVVVVVARVINSRRPDDAPTQERTWRVPAQVDRRDFVRPDAPWLVVVFSSATCQACASMVSKAVVLATDAVAVAEVEYSTQRSLHERYAIDAVPTTIVVDADGVVRQSYLGPVSATDLWAGVASVRDPSARPVEQCQRHEHPPEPSGA